MQNARSIECMNGGRLYMNLSLFSSVFNAFGMSRERMNYESEEFFGSVPDHIEIPEVKFSRGELSRKAYLRAFGHRGPHEMALSFPRPAEDPDWLEGQLQGLADEDVAALLARLDEQVT